MRHGDIPDLPEPATPGPDRSARLIHSGDAEVTLVCGDCVSRISKIAVPMGDSRPTDVHLRPLPRYPASLYGFVYHVPSGWFVSRVGSDPVLVLCPEHAKVRGKAGVP